MRFFYNINGIFYKTTKDGSMEKVVNPSECENGTCLVVNTNSQIEKRYIYTNVFDKSTKTDIIKRSLKNELGSFVYNSIVDGDHTFVFGLEKGFFLELNEIYKFKKVYPLEFFLYKLGTGRNGMVSNQLLFLKKYSDESGFISNYLNEIQSDTMYYVNMSEDVYIQNLQRIKDSESNINILFLSKEIEESASDGFNVVDIKQIADLVKTYENFYIKDRISKRYKKQVLHKYMLLADVALIAISVVVALFYLKNYANYTYYDGKTQEQQKKIDNFNKLNKDILSQLPKMQFNKFSLDSMKDSLTPLINYDPSKVSYTFDVAKNIISINMVISGVDKAEYLVSYLRENKIKNTYNKRDGYNFDFKIELKLDNTKTQEKTTKRGKR